MIKNKYQGRLVGSDMLLLATFSIIYPKANLDGMSTFIIMKMVIFIQDKT